MTEYHSRHMHQQPPLANFEVTTCPLRVILRLTDGVPRSVTVFGGTPPYQISVFNYTPQHQGQFYSPDMDINVSYNVGQPGAILLRRFPEEICRAAGISAMVVDGNGVIAWSMGVDSIQSFRNFM